MITHTTPGSLDYSPAAGWTATWTMGTLWHLGHDLDQPQVRVAARLCAERGITVEGDLTRSVYYDLRMATEAALAIAADDLLDV